ncbi:hypothetical protein HOLleu_29513 [Holothuria leucospilota]|uniref:Uncharacterized protein n=1 Tax=Holothuria leucospilota TaxID=206669 RepID=A0A9Q1BNM3_HOLLE|nr:hypothetical protein HOLleu_29513 [Holothuria leucospilota]
MATNWFYCFVTLVLTLETLAHPTNRSRSGDVRTATVRQPGRSSTRPSLHSEDDRNTAVSTSTITSPNSLPSTSLLDPSVPDPGTNVPSGTESLGLMTRIINSVSDNANNEQRIESSLRVTMNSEDTFLTDIQGNMEMNSVTSLPNQENSGSLEPYENGSTDLQQDEDYVISLNQQGNVALKRVLPPELRGRRCSPQMCENIFRINRKERGKSKPPPVPLKANNWRQIERQRQVIVQYNDLLSTTTSEGQLPPIPRNQAIVNLTGEEDDEVMGKFGSFFHNIEDVPPSDTNFRRGHGRHKRGTNVYVCAHEKSWEDILLAFSADNGLVQLYQTEELRQYVLTNRCTESRSSVVPGVVCVNDISTVNVIVVNFDSGLIEPTFINVETCRAKFVT